MTRLSIVNVALNKGVEKERVLEEPGASRYNHNVERDVVIR
jgi:hypothetical protein